MSEARRRSEAADHQKRSKSDRRMGEQGASAVEFALILPILMLLIGGVVDYGRYFFTEIQLTNAAREGARAGIVLGDPVLRATAAGSATPGWQTPTYTGNCSTNPTGDIVVTTSATFNFFFVNILPGVPNTMTADAQARMGCP